MFITEDIKYIGVNDHTVDLFEGMYQVPNGMSYNSYVILDEKIAIMDTVDQGFTKQWLMNLEQVLGEKKPYYLIVQHMEPDHSANIVHLLNKYPDTVVVASAKAFDMMKNFYGAALTDKQLVVSDGDTLSLGRHTLSFTTAPMVHWPEVIVTFDSTDQVLFSADGFGKFGANDVKEEWLDEARRYYFGIVGKYGMQVQNLLKKVGSLPIKTICPLHGPVLSENLEYYLKMYSIWSGYQPEEEGILIAYTSVYGNTKKAALLLEENLKEKGFSKVVVRDLARCDMHEAVAEAFRFSKLVLATTTYNGDIFPLMREFLNCLTERNFSNRIVAFIENGSWAVVAERVMKSHLEKCKGLIFTDASVKIMSALSSENEEQLKQLATKLVKNHIDFSEKELAAIEAVLREY